MISELLKQVMERFDLKQKDLVEVMGSSLSRVKAMTSGRVKNFTQNEIANLVWKLEIRAEWLISGEGPMLLDDETQEAFVTRIRAIEQARTMIDALPIGIETKERSKILITGDPTADAKVIAGALAAALPYETGGATVLTARESALIDNYRAASDAGKKALETTGIALAKPQLDDEGKTA